MVGRGGGGSALRTELFAYSTFDATPFETPFQMVPRALLRPGSWPRSRPRTSEALVDPSKAPLQLGLDSKWTPTPSALGGTMAALAKILVAATSPTEPRPLPPLPPLDREEWPWDTSAWPGRPGCSAGARKMWTLHGHRGG